MKKIILLFGLLLSMINSYSQSNKDLEIGYVTQMNPIQRAQYLDASNYLYWDWTYNVEEDYWYITTNLGYDAYRVRFFKYYRDVDLDDFGDKTNFACWKHEGWGIYESGMQSFIRSYQYMNNGNSIDFNIYFKYYNYSGYKWVKNDHPKDFFDCNDNNSSIPSGFELGYIDSDNDGFGMNGNGGPYLIECNTYNTVTNNTDCNDYDPTITTTAINWYADSDSDGYGDPSVFITSCGNPSSGSLLYVLNSDDCNDQDSRYHNDSLIWYADLDNDGFGDPNDTVVSSCPVANYVTNCYFDECPTLAGTRENGCPITSFDFDNANQNHTYLRAYLSPFEPEDLTTSSSNDVLEQINYLDGLNRIKQENNIGSSPLGKDIVTHHLYDGNGEKNKIFLPYSLTTSTGLFDSNSEINTLNYYNDAYYEFTTNPYAEKLVEDSPRSRALELGAQGNDWQIDPLSDLDHTKKYDYQSNSLNLSDSNADNVVLYDVIFPTGDIEKPQLYVSGYYQENNLYKTIIKNENWEPSLGKDYTTEIFKDKNKKIVLKRTYNNGINHDSYHIYDDYGNLTYMISPKGSNEILSSNTYTSISQSIKHTEFVPKDKTGTPITAGGGHVNVILNPTNNTLQVNFSLSFNTAIDMQQGPIALLEEYAPNMIIGTTSDGNYLVSIQGGFLHVTGSGAVNNVSDSFTVNLPEHSVDDTVLEDLCYQYHYDYKNRIVEKKLPGKDWEYIVYDAIDRPVLTQDALLRENNDWLFTKYDVFGRVVYTGKSHFTPAEAFDNAGRLELQEDVDNQLNFYEERLISVSTISGTPIYYSNDVIPYVSTDVFTINYYDDYNVGLTSDLNYEDSYSQSQSQNDKGLSTVNMVRVLGTDDWKTTVSYYDEKARPIYMVSKNEYLNTLDKVKSKLDFVGKVLETEANHVKGTNPSIVAKDHFVYDHTGRLISQKQQLNDDVPELIAKNYYDELGQLYQKEVGGETIIDGYTDLVEVTVDNSTGEITKTGVDGWNAGIATKGKFYGDGFVECTPEQNNKLINFGLSPINHNSLYFTHIHYSMRFTWGGQIKIFKGSIEVSGSFGTYSAGETFRVERIGNQIHYMKVGSSTPLHTITLSVSEASESLLGDMSMYKVGSKVSNFRIESASLNSVLQTVDYKYNIRGWLKEINDVDDLTTNEDLFALKLNYNTQEYNTSYDRKLYNGNVSETIWNSMSSWTPPSISIAESQIKRAYTYEYDHMHRIKQAIFTKDGGVNQNGYFNLKHVDYDRNGNIVVLRRSGYKESTDEQKDWMDRLTYTYEGNQLTDIKEIGNKYMGFANYDNSQMGDYEYDVNGNMVRDYNKEIGDAASDVDGITYNHLNLPTQVIFDNDLNNKIDYIYDATGVKLEKQVTKAGVLTSTRYAGNFIYEETVSDGENLKFFSHPEGYIEPVNTVLGVPGDDSYRYTYQYKDHLGNIRLSYNDSNNDGAVNNTEIIEENNYYPFGLKHKGYNNVINGTDHKYGFQEQEENDEHKLNWLSFKWRNHNPEIARFMSIDPLAGKYNWMTPYQFASNQPIHGREIEGLENENPLDDWDFGDDSIKHFELAESDLGMVEDTSDPISDIGDYEEGDDDYGFGDYFMDFYVDPFFNWDIEGERNTRVKNLRGSNMYGRGNVNLSQLTNGKIDGAWHAEDLLTPGGGGGQITRWRHLNNTGDKLMRTAGDGISALGHGVGLAEEKNKIIENNNNEIIEGETTVKNFSIDLYSKSVDSFDVTRKFSGERERVDFQIDSTIQNSDLQRQSVNNWFNN